jgi:hypothetical protein
LRWLRPCKGWAASRNPGRPGARPQRSPPQGVGLPVRSGHVPGEALHQTLREPRRRGLQTQMLRPRRERVLPGSLRASISRAQRGRNRGQGKRVRATQRMHCRRAVGRLQQYIQAIIGVGRDLGQSADDSLSLRPADLERLVCSVSRYGRAPTKTVTFATAPDRNIGGLELGVPVGHPG